MGIRFTGVSTPIGGLSWEYTDSGAERIPLSVAPGQKLRVFISSKCGDDGKYDEVIRKLKEAIEKTRLADVYTFESRGASTLSAGAHFTWALEDSDVCIFLIDNAEEIPSGVMDEIDTVKKNGIKALYYFCDEHSSEKTVVEQSLKGAKFAKNKTIHRFEDLVNDGLQDLINDIIGIYHYYCKGRLIERTEPEGEETQSIDIADIENSFSPTVPKTVLKNIDKCCNYIFRFVTGRKSAYTDGEPENTGDMDEWCLGFLKVMLEGKSVREFNTGMLPDVLRSYLTDNFFRVVELRWKAIQAYFSGEIQKTIEYLEKALQTAKESEQPGWVIKDILVDLRNLYSDKAVTDNQYFSASKAQDELTDSKEEIYYPVIDRLMDTLNEKYIDGLYKEKVTSPRAVTFGNEIRDLCELLAGAYAAAVYNGSLTHIILLYRRLKRLFFYLSCRYSDRSLKCGLFKLAIFDGNEKDAKELQFSSPEILNFMTADDARDIMDFCDNQPLGHVRFSVKLCALGAVGYYLNDADFKKYSDEAIKHIKEWMDDRDRIWALGSSVIKCIKGIAYRLDQNTLAELCCDFFDLHYINYYREIFPLIESYIDLRKMEQNTARKFMKRLTGVLEDEGARKLLGNTTLFPSTLRKQDLELTEEMDRTLETQLPEFYNGAYTLEVTDDPKVLSRYVERYISSIKHRNETQGKGGVYSGYDVLEIEVIRKILLVEGFSCAPGIMDSLIETVAETLMKAKEDVNIKSDAAMLLACIALRYKDDYRRNYDTFKYILNNKDDIEVNNNLLMSANVSDVALDIALQLLFISMGENVCLDMMKSMSYIRDDISTTIRVSGIICEFYGMAKEPVIPEKVEFLILQNALQWLNCGRLEIRRNATVILFNLLKNPEYRDVINSQLIYLVDNENLYIKNVIMRRLNKVPGIKDSTKNYIMKKCENDANYLVRMVWAEENETHDRC